MAISKRNLKDEIRNGTSLLEIIGENIDVHAELYANSFYVGKERTKKEIIKIVIEDLNDELNKK
jgi:rubrerythrin